MDVALTANNDAVVEGPWALPEGWAWSSIGEAALVIAGQSPPSETYNEGREGLPFFQGKAEFGERHPTVRKWCSAPTKIADAGDILISVRAPVGPTNVADVRCGIGRGLAAIRANEWAEPQWLLYWLRFSEQQLAARGTGTTFAAITGDVLREHLAPLAPLAQQRRIVARIDALFAEIAEGEAALASARKGLGIFRRALLKAAVTGELTKDWRAENPAAEAAQDFLTGIADDRGGRPAVQGRRRRSTEVNPIDASSLPALPMGWVWAQIGQVVSTVEYGTSEKCDFGYDGVPVLRMGNVEFGSLNYTRLKYAPKESEPPILQIGDLVFNRTNSAELVGKCAVYRGDVSPCSLASYLIRVRFDGVSSDFAALWINSAYGRKWIATNKSQQVGQANLSGGTLKGMPIPIPPPLEVAEILRLVSNALAAATDTLTMLDAEAADAARLKQSILKAAFEGRLVPQDPADEPASVLLARIATDAPAPAKRGRGRKSNA